MKGMGREVVMIFFVGIILYLLLKDPTATANVVNAIGGQVSNATATLQGRGSTGTAPGAGAGFIPPGLG